MNFLLKPTLVRILGLFVLIIALSLSASQPVLGVWQEPTAAPPGNNRPEPLDISATAQTKAGSLTLQSTLTVSLIQGPTVVNGTLTASSNNGDGVYGISLTVAEPTSAAAIHGESIGTGWAGLFEGPLGVSGGDVQFDSDYVLIANAAQTSQLCLNSDCIAEWGDIEGFWVASGNNIINTNIGNVGIGRPSPWYKFEVEGDIGIGRYLAHLDDGDTNMEFIPDQIQFKVGGEYLLKLLEDGAQDMVILGDGGDVDINLNNDLYTIGSSGYVGIGTNNPNKLLHVYKIVGDNAEIDIQSVDDNYWAVYQDRGSEDLRFWNTDSDNMLTLTNEGNVSMAGTLSVFDDLTVDGTVVLNENATIQGDMMVYGNISSGIGTITVDDNLTVTGYIKGNFVGAADATCAENQILKRSGGVWACAADEAVVGEGDNLGNHIATATIQLNDFALTNDGDDNEGIFIDDEGTVWATGDLVVSGVIENTEIMTRSDNLLISTTDSTIATFTQNSIYEQLILPLQNYSALPSLAFGDGDTGLYENADDSLKVAANGSVIATFTQDGTYEQLILPIQNYAAKPTLAFGDGDTGFYESADDTVYFAGEGTASIYFMKDGMYGYNSNNPGFLAENGTATNPNMVPRKGSKGTGIGAAAADNISLINNSIETMRLTDNNQVNILSVLSATDASDFFLNGNGNVQIRIDTDQGSAPGNNTFMINNGANQTVFEVDESGTIVSPEIIISPDLGIILEGDLSAGGDISTAGDVTVAGGDIKKSDGDSVIEFSGGNVIIHLGQ